MESKFREMVVKLGGVARQELLAFSFEANVEAEMYRFCNVSYANFAEVCVCAPAHVCVCVCMRTRAYVCVFKGVCYTRMF